MTTSDLGRVRPIYRGAYSPTASYTPLDFLSYDGNMYFCTLAATGVVPTDTGYFQPVIDPSWLVTLSKFNADMALKANKAVQIRAGKGLKLDGQTGTDATPASGDLSADRLLGLNLADFAVAQAVWSAGVSGDEAPISPAKLRAAILSVAGAVDPQYSGIGAVVLARTTSSAGTVGGGSTVAGGFLHPAWFSAGGALGNNALTFPGTWRNCSASIDPTGYGIFQRIV